jgi:hypothetical protein
VQYCLSTAGSQPIEAVAEANDAGAASAEYKANDSLPNGGNAQAPRFFQLYMGHDDEVVCSHASFSYSVSEND